MGLKDWCRSYAFIYKNHRIKSDHSGIESVIFVFIELMSSRDKIKSDHSGIESVDEGYFINVSEAIKSDHSGIESVLDAINSLFSH